MLLDYIDKGIPQQEGYVLYHITGCYDGNNICLMKRSDKSDNDSILNQYNKLEERLFELIKNTDNCKMMH